jgi:hypothetical protein
LISVTDFPSALHPRLAESTAADLQARPRLCQGRSAAIAAISRAADRRANRARSSSGPVMISARAWLIA